MKALAGVLLITIGIINIGAGIGYGFLGRVAEGLGTIGQEVSDSAGQAASQRADQSAQQAAQKGKEVSGMLKIFGGSLALFGLGLLVLAGCQIAAGIFTMDGKKPTFVLVVCALEILVSLMILTSVPGWMCPAFGIFAAGIGLFAVLSDRKSEPAVDAAQA